MSLGFQIDGVPIPDPSGFSGEVADLDTSAERDTTGKLHRTWVAQKIPLNLSYANITWNTCQTILQALNKKSFSFTFPNPNTGSTKTGTYYVGNRKWEAVYMAGASGTGWYANLDFSVIEY